MDGRALSAAGVVVAAFMVFNVWSLSGMEARLTALEARELAQPVAAVAEPRERRFEGQQERRPRTERGAMFSGRHELEADEVRAGSDGVGDLDLDDPAVREKLEGLVEETAQRQREQRWEERSARWLESMNTEIEDVGAELKWNADKTAAVRITLEEWHWAKRDIFSEVHNGNGSWFEARREVEGVNEQYEAQLRESLGDDDYDVVDERLFTDWRR